MSITGKRNSKQDVVWNKSKKDDGELLDHALEKFDQDMELCRRLMKSIPKRLEAVLKVGGNQIRRPDYQDLDEANNNQDNYLNINRQSWNNKVAIHIDSDFYGMASFRQGKNSLHSIELDLLGDLQGKRVLHLQCHFGQDSISMSRLGANVTGIDLSDKAIDAARHLAEELGTDTQFVCSDVYDLPQHLEGQFDVVFTSYGVLGWLPDLDRWAAVIDHFLKPDGRLVLVEFHPVLWMFDDDFQSVDYAYFKSEDIVETYEGTYADVDAPLKQAYVSWNHGLGEVFQALQLQGLRVDTFQEFDYSPYDCFGPTVQIAPDRYQIKHLAGKLPMVYAVVASRG